MSIGAVIYGNSFKLCQAPFPVLARTMEKLSIDIEEGILVNLDTKECHRKCGDERNLLPENLRKSPKVINIKVMLLPNTTRGRENRKNGCCNFNKYD
jgi:hypothetical protein